MVEIQRGVLKQARKYVKRQVEDAADEIESMQKKIEETDNEHTIEFAHDNIRLWHVIKGRAEQNLESIDEVLDNAES